ncbi:MAG: pilus assembly protein TadG-related protein [Bryobacteraceae bacterium]|nr:pilus assembly protein TadG-related protein [Bryobacteraceae bacterium]
MQLNRRRQRGFVGITGALLLLVLMMFGGLAIDVGYLQWQKRQAQLAADAAAVGAVQELRSGGGGIVTAGQNDAALNGFTNGVNNTTVTVTSPPVYGSLAGSNSAVEAIVTRTVPTLFMMLAGRNTATISARAVASNFSTGGSSSGCVVALNKTVQRALGIAGSNATYSACSWVSESSHATAFHMEGSGTLYMQNGAAVGVVGGYQLSGQTKVWDVVTNAAKNPVVISDPGDPLKDVVAPTSGGPVRATNANYDMNSKPAGNTLQPGTYCNGLRIGNTGGVTFTMAPGTYILAGGGMTFNSQAKISAIGVTIYNTTSAGWGCAGTHSFSPMTIDGQAQLTMSAPTSGSLKGMAIFQDRSIVDTRDNKVVGGATTVIDGALYFKGSPLKFSGNSSSTGYMFLVADTITINGNSTLGANYTTVGGSNPFLPPASGGLAE